MISTETDILRAAEDWSRSGRQVAIAIWPFSTRVKRSRISSVGWPIAPPEMKTVGVMSVVPSGYCPPESTR